MRNGLHASSSKKHAQEEIRLLFPDYELAPSPSADPMPADEVEHNDLARINPLFHHVFDSYHLEGDGRTVEIEPSKNSCLFFDLLQKSSLKFLLILN